MEAEDEVNETEPKVLLCEVCAKERSKYKCPKCSYRTCSLICSKKHKEELQCSGQRETSSFGIVRRLADCTAATIAEDEKFLVTVKESLENIVSNVPKKEVSDDFWEKSQLADGVSEAAIEPNLDDSVKEPGSCSPDKKSAIENEEQSPRFSSLTLKQRYLCNNAQRRRIWLTIPKDKEEDGSRHEQHSDTIFWTIDMIFRREVQNERNEKSVIDYTFTTNSIPESISVSTLVRQFIKPKKIGPVVNRDELDSEKLLPFQEAGMDGLTVYMPVPMENKERFYVVDMKKTILDNSRNRYIIGHPTFIVTLDTQMGHYVMLSEQEAQEMREAQRARNQLERKEQSGFRGNRFRDRQNFHKRMPGHGRFTGQKRFCSFEEGGFEGNDFIEKKRREGNEESRGNPRFSNYPEEERRGYRDRRGFRGRGGFRRFENNRSGYRDRDRHTAHPLEMSPAELAAADANRSLSRQNLIQSSQDAASIAWAKAVDSHLKQEVVVPPVDA